MSAGNLLSTRKKAFDLRTKAVTAAYTVRVGATGDNFLSDRVITITNPAESFAIALPAGSYFGQEILISLLANDNGKTVTVNKAVPVGGSVGLSAAGDYASLEYVNDTAGWILLHHQIDGD